MADCKFGFETFNGECWPRGVGNGDVETTDGDLNWSRRKLKRGAGGWRAYISFRGGRRGGFCKIKQIQFAIGVKRAVDFCAHGDIDLINAARDKIHQAVTQRR